MHMTTEDTELSVYAQLKMDKICSDFYNSLLERLPVYMDFICTIFPVLIKGCISVRKIPLRDVYQHGKLIRAINYNTRHTLEKNVYHPPLATFVNTLKRNLTGKVMFDHLYMHTIVLSMIVQNFCLTFDIWSSPRHSCGSCFRKRVIGSTHYTRITTYPTCVLSLRKLMSWLRQTQGVIKSNKKGCMTGIF